MSASRRFLARSLFLAGGFAVIVALVALFLVANQVTVTREQISARVIQEPASVARAWKLPVASTYSGRIDGQSNPSLCGPASVANVNRSFHDQADTETLVLAKTGRCWTGFCLLGLTLDELADVARKNTKRRVTLLRDLTLDEFRQHLKRSNDPTRRYVINFKREEIFGSGVGHHSPIGGYLEPDDLVFVLDVNDKFGPWLVESSRLYSAMNTLDGRTTRGLLFLE